MTNLRLSFRNVFLGLAYDRLNNNAEAESAYSAATKINADDKTAWQGLVSLYEKEGGCEHDGYRQAVIALGNIFADGYALHFSWP
jgi:superkiller protein 3